MPVDAASMTDKQIYEISVPNPYDFPITVGKRRLIVIEGPNCVGKTTMAKNLSMLMSFNIQVHSFGILDRSPDILLGEILAISRYGDKIIQDRSILSWMFYNGMDWDSFNVWLENIQNGFVAVVCMIADFNVVEKFSTMKKEVFDRESSSNEFRWFSDMFNRIPMGQRIDCYRTNDRYVHWDVYNKLLRMWGR